MRKYSEALWGGADTQKVFRIFTGKPTSKDYVRMKYKCHRVVGKGAVIRKWK